MSNGCRFAGDWKDGKRHGKGVFYWTDGSFYDGEWENDNRHGRGILELTNGFKYEGNWVNNYMEGKGTSIFPGGQEYTVSVGVIDITLLYLLMFIAAILTVSIVHLVERTGSVQDGSAGGTRIYQVFARCLVRREIPRRPHRWPGHHRCPRKYARSGGRRDLNPNSNPSRYSSHTSQSRFWCRCRTLNASFCFCYNRNICNL